MTDERFPNDPYRPASSEDELDRAARRDSELQADPELREGRASNTKITLFAIAIAAVLGTVFYGLNNSSVQHAGTAPPAQTAQTQPAPPAANNKEPGTTTGSAMNRPSAPQSTPQGPEVDRAATPPSNDGANKQ